jgi:hypothetical protein
MDKVEKIHKAIVDIAIATSALCGAGTFVEWELQHLIDNTKNVIVDVMKPAVANGLSTDHWKALAEGQRQFQKIENTPSIAEKLTDEQRNEIRIIIRDFSTFDFSNYTSNEKGGAPSTLAPPPIDNL